MPAAAEPELNLLLNWEQPGEERFLRAGAGSIVVHIVLGFLLLVILKADAARKFVETVHRFDDLSKATPLFAPKMTQTTPNINKPSKEINLESLLSKPQPVTAPPRNRFEAPKPMPAPGQPAPSLAAPPKIDTKVTSPVLAQGVPNPILPPPVAPAPKPKLAFETPGVSNGSTQLPANLPRIEPPKTSVADAIQAITRNPGGGGVVVGDADDEPGGDPLHPSPQHKATRSQLELLSDPKGVDFRPYLIQVLAAVRRNWFAVIPESARLGRRGRVQIQFAIAQNGNVPKLVIASPSGAEALDRAAVASISASNPFPPLPPQFHGAEIRLQLSFTYAGH